MGYLSSVQQGRQNILGEIQTWPEHGALKAQIYGMRQCDWQRLKLAIEGPDQDLFGFEECEFLEGVKIEGAIVYALRGEQQETGPDYDWQSTIHLRVEHASREVLERMETVITEACSVVNPEH